MIISHYRLETDQDVFDRWYTLYITEAPKHPVCDEECRKLLICGQRNPSYDDVLECINSNATTPVNRFQKDTKQSPRENIAEEMKYLANSQAIVGEPGNMFSEGRPYPSKFGDVHFEGQNPKSVAAYVGQQLHKSISELKEDNVDKLAV